MYIGLVGEGRYNNYWNQQHRDQYKWDFSNVFQFPDSLPWAVQHYCARYSHFHILHFTSQFHQGDSIPSLTVVAKSKAPHDVLPITTSCWTNMGQRTVSFGQEPDKLVIFREAIKVEK